ncbi:MAG: hypothetical protein NT023_22600 [Armatimonadetes bacterium]|nr:hypothetical protein [Armatimonadota bacterium]
MCKSYFIIGIPDERKEWRRVIGTPKIEVLTPLSPKEYFAHIAKLDIEVLTASLCAMSLGITIQEGSAGVHAVQDARCAPLVIAPPLDLATGDLPFVKNGDSVENILKSANYAIAQHKWSCVFDTLNSWIIFHNREYRVGFNCNWVDFRPQNDTEEVAVVLAFLDIFAQYSGLFW